jgi:hypothetical protein
MTVFWWWVNMFPRTCACKVRVDVQHADMHFVTVSAEAKESSCTAQPGSVKYACAAAAAALPCPALPCPALPCPALPCPALPCPALRGKLLSWVYFKVRKRVVECH